MSFRLANRRIHLTYKSHIDPETWLSWAKIRNFPIDLYSIVHEIGEDNYKHTHILLDAGKSKKFISSAPRCFDWTDSFTNEIIHPNIKTITTNKHWENSVTYHHKQNKPFTNIVKPLNTKETIENIWKCDKVSDALLTTCKTLKEVGGVIAAFNCKPDEYGLEPEIEWRPWQQDLYEELKQKPDDRRILWYFDPAGGSGKTLFTKHMGKYKGAFVSTKANVYHVATSIDEFIKKNGNSILIVIFNFTRQQECHNVYQALEELKDGLVTSEKYKGKTTFFDSPHVVVFANYMPEIKHLTIDRWDIRTIQNNKVVKRYVGGETILTDESIDKYIDYSLKGIETQFKNLNLKIPLKPLPTQQKNVPKMPQQPGSPLNIKTGTPPASQEVPPPAPREIKGKWHNKAFKADCDFIPPNSTHFDNLIINGSNVPGKWINGTFYPEKYYNFK